MMGKLCEIPVQPLSRSLPVGGTVKVTWLGRPGASRLGQLMLPPGGRHCTTSLFLKPLDFMRSVTFLDGLVFLRGLAVFFGTRMEASWTVPAFPHEPAGDTGGATKPVRFFKVGPVKVIDDRGVGVQPAVASPTQAFRLITQMPFGSPSASHVGSPSLQLSVLFDGATVAAAGPVSHTAEQLPFLPVNSAACAGDSSPAVSAIVAASEVRGESLIRVLLRRRAPARRKAWSMGSIASVLKRKTREADFLVTVIS